MSADIALRPADRLCSSLTEAFRAYGAILGMIAVFVIIAIIKPSFGHIANIENVLRRCTVLLIMSLGLTLVLAMRGVDLCVAQTVDAAAIMSAGLLVHGAPIWLAFTAPLVLGVVIGLLNGLLTAYLGIPAVIATLGMMFIVRSGELTYGSDPQILFTLPDSTTRVFFFLDCHSVAGVPALIGLALIVFFAVYALATRTAFGREARAVGSMCVRPISPASTSAVYSPPVFGERRLCRHCGCRHGIPHRNCHAARGGVAPAGCLHCCLSRHTCFSRRRHDYARLPGGHAVRLLFSAVG
jgi:predicted ABC-type sugar transport system permease subunit